MTAGILVNKGRNLSGVSEELAGDVYCGGCQTQLKDGHRAGCPSLSDFALFGETKEGESRCMDCLRPESMGHSQDCSEMVSRFGVQMGGW